MNTDDDTLFKRAMRNVKPLKQDKIYPHTTAPKPIPQQRQYEIEQIQRDMLSDVYDPAELETGEELVFIRPGVQTNVLKKMRRGYYSVVAELDLHGLVVREAREAVGQFLRDCRLQRARFVRIVHGKGYGSPGKQPILKVKLNKWLQQREEVLAFCSARQVDGGTGALYVLLKQY